MLPQAVIVFAVIALLAVMLRWVYGRERRAKPPWPPENTSADGGRDTDDSDFGLLAPVALVDTAEEAQRVRALLADAGIRATTRVTVDGRHRVLVFETEVHRARRISDPG